MSEWKTIDSAPKDGTRIDGWAVNTVTGKPVGRFTDMRWEYGEWTHGSRTFTFPIEIPVAADTGVPVVKLTHWMPLPSPPKGDANG